MGNYFNIVNFTDAKKMISKKNLDLILDVRTSMEWKRGHYSTSTHIKVKHIELEDVKKKFKKKYPNKQIKVLIYCTSGMRAVKAVQTLKSQGYKNIYFLNDSGYTNLF